jgi:hypothetical protein
MSKYLEDFKDIYDDFFDRSESLIYNGYWHLPKYVPKFDDKNEDFKHTQNAASAVLEGLKAFIEGAEGERNEPGIQPYINKVVKTINLHLERIRKYYPSNKPSNFIAREDQKLEALFQQNVFKGEQSIRTILNKLNLDNNFDKLEVKFHSDKIASIPMKISLELYSLDIKEKIQTLDISWEKINDKEFFINYKKEKVPLYNARRHFFDQEKETLKFYVSEYNKIKKGITIDGYFVHPWLYFHLNFFNTPIPVVHKDGTKEEKVMLPPFRDNEWYFAEILKRVDARGDCGALIYGSRRFSKSSLIASYLLWKATISPNGNLSVTGGNDIDLGDLTDKMETGMKAMHPAFRLQTNKEEWLKEVEFGLKSKSNEKIKMADTRITNLAAGAKRSSQKTAGGAPVAFVIEEIGKFSWRDAFDTAIPSFETLDGWKTVPLLIGTGGEESLSKDAEKVLANPEQNDLMEIDWDLLEWQIPKEAITWIRRPFGWFVPAQMGYKTGYKRIERTFADFLQIDSKKLSKIKILQTDWINNTEICKKRREKLKSDAKKLQKEIVFYPLDPEECFMSATKNPFPAQDIKQFKERQQSSGDPIYGSGRRVTLEREGSRIIAKLSDKKVATFPFNGDYTDAPFIVYGDFPESRPEDQNRYIAGLDDYKHEGTSGDSIGAFYIFDRLTRKIVLSLANRPDPHSELHRQIHMALDAYNAKCFAENEDLSIKTYFDRLSNASQYLAKGFDPMGDFSIFTNNKRMYGWRPDKNTVQMVRGFVIDYSKESFDVLDNKEDIIRVGQGFERIEDIQLMEEMIKFKPDGNFDRLVALGSCLIYDHYLTSHYIIPKALTKRENKNLPQASFKAKKNMWTKKRRGLF